MGRQGYEVNEFYPNEFDDLPVDKPMSEGDATGAPTRKRYERELAFRAWKHIEGHNTKHALPDWVEIYLQGVATARLSDLGPQGGLSPPSAHAALGLVGQQWPEHHPNKVYLIIRSWMEPQIDTKKPLVSGRKAGAARYIQELMTGEREVNIDTVIEWYSQGQKANARD